MNRVSENPDSWHLVTIPGECQIGTIGEAPGEVVGTGWVNDPVAVGEVLDAWHARGQAIHFASAAPALMREASGDAPVFLWLAEKQFFGKLLPTWNQRKVGCCVGFGSTRAAQDLMLTEIVDTGGWEWPGELAPEITYGGSRHEIGQDRIRGDGSVGAWAAEFLTRYGVLQRGVYGSLDLTSYSEDTVRRLGRAGVPDELEGTVRLHPVTASALVTTEDEIWAALGGGKPVFLCSDQGFSYNLVNGFAAPQGVWNHCMAQRGRFTHPRNGPSGVIGNSWDNYLSGDPVIEYVDVDGKTKTIELPPGHFSASMKTIGHMARQRDSFALAGLRGWAKTKVDYTPGG